MGANGLRDSGFEPLRRVTVVSTGPGHNIWHLQIEVDAQITVRIVGFVLEVVAERGIDNGYRPLRLSRVEINRRPGSR